MTELTVAPNEHGVLRLFSLDMRPQEARFLREPGAVDQILGTRDLDPEQIEVFPVSDLEDLGLYGYLSEGCGISEDQLDQATLGAMTGWVMVLRSRAFRGKAQTLTPDNRVRLAALFTEDRTSWSAEPIETASAKPYSAPRIAPRKTRAEAVRVGFTLFAIVMSMIIGGILWLVL